MPEGDDRTEVGRLARAFNGMVGRIEGAFRAQAASEEQARASEGRMRRFVADASHELRTPLTSIRGFAELYRQGAYADPAETHRMMGRIESEASRMGSLVEDLLQLARLDQQRPVAALPVDLGELADDAVHDARAVATDRPITLDMDDSLTDVPVVLGDEGRLRQVLANLVTNALTHTPAAPPSPSGWPRTRPTPTSSSSRWPTRARASPEDAERVFERFYRADASRTRVAGGSGLGLSIVSSLVAAHHGTVTLTTAPGQGATFTVPAAPHGPDRSGLTARCETPGVTTPGVPARRTPSPPTRSCRRPSPSWARPCGTCWRPASPPSCRPRAGRRRRARPELTARLAAATRDRHTLSAGRPADLPPHLLPVSGVGHGFAPPVQFRRDGDTVVGECTLGLRHEGPPAHSHGGMTAMLMDQLLGSTAFLAGRWGMTAHLGVEYRGAVPLQTPAAARRPGHRDLGPQDRRHRDRRAGRRARARAGPRRGRLRVPARGAAGALLRRPDHRRRPAAPGHAAGRDRRERPVNDVQVAVAAARAAAEVLLPLRDGGLRDGALGDAGDAAAQRAIAAVLAAHRPGDAVLSEEAADDPARLAADRVWVVDPLDGTKEYRPATGTTGRCTWRCGSGPPVT